MKITISLLVAAIAFHGLVSISQAGTTDLGTLPVPTTVTISDSNLSIGSFSDTFKFNLFGKEYVEYGKYMQVGMCLLIKAKIQKRIRDEQRTELEVRINKITLLSEARSEIRKVIKKVDVDFEEFFDIFCEIIFHACHVAA